MVKPLRSAHRLIWLILAFMLPGGIICAWLVIPDPVPVVKLARPAVRLLPVIQAQSESLQHCINIRSSADKASWQVEWRNKLPLTVPSALIYQTGKTTSYTSHAKLIGRIEATGDYVFDLRADSSLHKELNLLLYDFIHERAIDSFTFKINR